MDYILAILPFITFAVGILAAKKHYYEKGREDQFDMMVEVEVKERDMAKGIPFYGITEEHIKEYGEIIEKMEKEGK